MASILNITALDTISIRHEVLRKGKPIESCYFDSDNEQDTAHFGVFVNKKIVGCVSIIKNINANFDAENQFQVRGMAVLESYQGKGLGKLLLLACEKEVGHGAVLWFNARESAMGFYRSLGYQIAGAPFMIETIGMHFLMYKNIR